VNWKTVVLAICGMGMMVAIIHPSTVKTPVPPPERVVVVKHADAKQPDGYMSEEDCARIDAGMAVSNLVWKFGWPASDYAYSNYDQRFFYPVHDRGDDRCVIAVDDNKVVSALYRDE
jgi:hypothetical protein